MPGNSKNPLAELRAFTPARIGIGRAGSGVPTQELLSFGLAHARARDAVHAALDVDRLGLDAPVVHSRALDRETYLRRPDLGRRLSEEASLKKSGKPVALVIADGLSATAVQSHAVPLIKQLTAIAPERWAGAPAVVALQARVALGDEIGERLGAQLVCVLIGERPGLSSPDSLGCYLTFAPRVGRTDAERNCVSNIRPQGLSYEAAARRIDWLAAAALARGLSGIGLKDESS
ncbi:MAG TPA: ethanolamine ammonia-lyase subunit EutC [Burkholderiales bacterium]|jgi:ethanolamine ammonia-lyase small subunit|nr:ethanolamine ammonia-lyase subunit EutC [Burkholderiales bacterium]HEX2650292.1 ethanolamine ammonia-lyase subunit EutC [Burkholderiales bacterium]